MNYIESSLVSKVNEKQNQDPIFIELEANVHKQKVIAFEQGGDCILGIKVGCVCQGWMNSNGISCNNLISIDILSIRVPQRCTVTS